MSQLFRHGFSGVLSIGILAGCGGGGGGSAALPTSSSSIVRPSGYALTWSDEFDQGSALDDAWKYDLGEANLGGSNWGNAELQYYTSNSANVRLEDGDLVIQAVAGKPAGVNLQFGNILATSARVTTDTPAFYSALGNQPYGYYEIKAQIPCVAGAWPAIWMLGRDGVWPDRGELDIMEWFGKYFANQPDQVQSAIHTRARYGENPIYQKLQLPGFCQGFHRFQLHWETSRLTFGVDDQIILTYDKPVNATNDNWPFDKPAHLLLNVAVGGNLGGNVDVTDIPAMRMLVDYVKVWQPR